AGDPPAGRPRDPRDRSGEREPPPRRFAPPRRPPAAPASVLPPVDEPLAQEGRKTRRPPLPDDERRIVPEAHPVRAQRTVDLGLPEPAAPHLACPLEQRAPVGAIVARDLRVLASWERSHVARVAAEVLGPVGAAEPLARGD